MGVHDSLYYVYCLLLVSAITGVYAYIGITLYLQAMSLIIYNILAIIIYSQISLRMKSVLVVSCRLFRAYVSFFMYIYSLVPSHVTLKIFILIFIKLLSNEDKKI